MRDRPADEDLIRSVLAALGSAPTDPRLMLEIARLRTELLSADRIERTFRDRQGAMATELRTILTERGESQLDAAVRAEVVAGAVFAALAVWTEGAGAARPRRPRRPDPAGAGAGPRRRSRSGSRPRRSRTAARRRRPGR